MAFHSLTRIRDQSINGRWYLHNSGVDVLGVDARKLCKELWGGVMTQLPKELVGGHPLYVLGFFYGYTTEAVLDLFVPRSKSLPLNWMTREPLYQALQYHEGRLTNHPGIYPCMDVITAFAAEEKLRTKTASLERFLHEGPRYTSDFVKLQF